MGFDPRPRERLIATRLDYLFRAVHPRDRGPYTPAEVADAINKAAEEKVISGTYVWQLRTGRKDNPTYKHLVALSRFFGVSPAYFFDEGDLKRGVMSPEAQVAFADDAARDLALRSMGLSERSIGVIREMVENARALENLKDPDPSAATAASADGSDAAGVPEK